MLCKTSSRTLVLLAIVLQLAAVGCQRGQEKTRNDAGTATAEALLPKSSDAGTLLPPERPYPAKFYYLDLAGEEDYRNYYSAAVEITTSEPMEAGIHGRCSGVLLSPQLVLTAGHCVCVRRPTSTPGNEGKFIIDGASCAQTPEVTTKIWDVSTGDDFIPSGAWTQDYTGKEVWAHPSFQILLDKDGHVESSRADLALILLQTPVERKYTPLRIADEEIRLGETIVLVGGRSDEFQSGIAGGDRRFRRFKTVGFTSPGSDRVLFDQPQRDLFKGDSGGPCVREGQHGRALVGVSSRGLGSEPTFTSIHLYRDWLNSALRSMKPR
jgi:hypothetical protein